MKESEGVLPGMGWLRINGWWGLYRAIQKRPEIFAHLEQDRFRATDEEAVALAEKLARKNKGKIPKSWWLVKNGHSGLDHRMRHKPELFAHLEQVRLHPKGRP